MDTPDLTEARRAENPLCAFYFNPFYLFTAIQAYGDAGVTVGELYEGDCLLPAAEVFSRFDTRRSDTRRSLLSMDLVNMRHRGWLRVVRKKGPSNVYVAVEMPEALPWRPPS